MIINPHAHRCEQVRARVKGYQCSTMSVGPSVAYGSHPLLQLHAITPNSAL